MAAAEAVLKANLAETKKYEVEAEARKEKIAKLKTQQLEVKTNKEYSTIQSEIKTIQDSISKLEDEQLVVMEEVEKAKAEVKQKKAALVDEEKAVQDDVGLLDQRLKTIGQELAKIRETRALEAKDIDSKWLAQYERIFARKDKGIVHVEDGVCGGCHMALPPAVIHRAKRMDNNMVVCDFCGRLLY